MCLFGQQEGLDAHAFSEFYKYQQDKEVLNKAVDMLLDYFPDRSGLRVAGTQM